MPDASKQIQAQSVAEQNLEDIDPGSVISFSLEGQNNPDGRHDSPDHASSPGLLTGTRLYAALPCGPTPSRIARLIRRQSPGCRGKTTLFDTPHHDAYKPETLGVMTSDHDHGLGLPQRRPHRAPPGGRRATENKHSTETRIFRS
jgi:hypothetical protein